MVKKKNWKKVFYAFLGLFIILLLVPDPLPFIDEIATGLIATVTGYLSFKK